MLAVVIVLYKRSLAESQSHRSLTAALEAAGLSPDDVCIVVYDNSPEASALAPPHPYPIDLVADPSNRGLVPAYNLALQRAHDAGAEWLLLLDQDTTLPVDYFSHFKTACAWSESRTAALVPRVRARGRIISPHLVLLGLSGLACVPGDRVGTFDWEITAINSGTFVRVRALRAWGGYPARYTLDAVDLWFFAQLYASGHNAYVMPTTIDHEISLDDPLSIKASRWETMLAAEVDYLTQMRPVSTRLLQTVLFGGRLATTLSRGNWVHARALARQTRRLLGSLRHSQLNDALPLS